MKNKMIIENRVEDLLLRIKDIGINFDKEYNLSIVQLLLNVAKIPYENINKKYDKEIISNLFIEDNEIFKLLSKEVITIKEQEKILSFNHTFINMFENTIQYKIAFVFLQILRLMKNFNIEVSFSNIYRNISNISNKNSCIYKCIGIISSIKNYNSISLTTKKKINLLAFMLIQLADYLDFDIIKVSNMIIDHEIVMTKSFKININ